VKKKPGTKAQERPRGGGEEDAENARGPPEKGVAKYEGRKAEKATFAGAARKKGKERTPTVKLFVQRKQRKIGLRDISRPAVFPWALTQKKIQIWGGFCFLIWGSVDPVHQGRENLGQKWARHRERPAQKACKAE